MKKFKPIALFFIGLIIGLIASVLIVEKQLWFWHVSRDRAMIRLEIRKINLDKQRIDELVRSLEGYMKEAEEILGIEEEE